MQIRFIEEISILVIFYSFLPKSICCHNCIFCMRIKFMQESKVKASLTQCTTYNLMSILPQDIMQLKRLRKKARKDIGCSTKFLEASTDNRLKPKDIWRRMMRYLKGI